MQDDNVDDAIFKAFQKADVRDSMYQMAHYSHEYISTTYRANRSLLHLASMHGLLTMCESLLGTSTMSTKLYASSSVC